MRKHFLILMLLALLPMASWAVTLDPNEFETVNVTYGTAADLDDILPVAPAAYTQGTDYVVDAVNFYPAAVDANPIAFSAIATTNAGQYYLKVTGQNSYSGQTVFVSFWISAVQLQAAWITGFDPVEYTGNAIEPSTAGKVVKPAVPAKTLVLNTDYTVTYADNTNAGTGHITFTGIGNFGGTVVKDFTISQRPFTADNVLIEIGENDFVYNAQAAGQAPTVTVKDKGTNKTIAAAEYVIKYDGSATKPKNAKDGIQIKVTGAGVNYTDAAIETAAMKYDIKKAALIVTPKVEKDYDGTDDLPAITQESALTLQGLLGEDTYAAVVLTGDIADALTVDDNVEANVGTYSLVVDATKLASANYKLTIKNGTFKINQKAIDIAVENKLDVPYGTSEADIIYTINAVGIDGADGVETKAIKRATKVTRATEPTIVEGQKRYALTPSKKDEAAAADLAVLANYKPTYKSTGYLTWTKGELTISLIEDNLTLTKVYDGTVPTLTVTEADFEVDGLAEGDDIAYLTYPTVTIVGAKKDVDTYQVKLSGASYPDDKYNINLVSSQYTITPKTLKMTLNDQTLLVGQKKDNFDLTAVAFAAGKGLATVDKAKDVYELVFNTGAGEGQINTTNFEEGDPTKALLVGAVGSYAKGIKVQLKRGVVNYVFEGAADPHATGKLIVVNGASVVLLDRNSADLAAFINTNKSDNNTDYKTVTFSNRPLAAETWQAYVLPFDVTPAELCANGLGYVIVNVLKPASTASNVKFGYTMQTIPAHTPFIMKTAEAKNMNNLVLADRIIKQVPATVVAQNTAKDVNFYGNYATKKGPFADNEYVMYIAPGENNKWVNSYSGDLSAMSGYLVLPESNNAPIFTVEDANGTTSILGVTADGRIVEAEGWYTLNGVKLQGVPSQKGIYIHNGKKLVVK